MPNTRLDHSNLHNHKSNHQRGLKRLRLSWSLWIKSCGSVRGDFIHPPSRIANSTPGRRLNDTEQPATAHVINSQRPQARETGRPHSRHSCPPEDRTYNIEAPKGRLKLVFNSVTNTISFAARKSSKSGAHRRPFRAHFDLCRSNSIVEARSVSLHIDLGFLSAIAGHVLASQLATRADRCVILLSALAPLHTLLISGPWRELILALSEQGWPPMSAGRQHCDMPDTRHPPPLRRICCPSLLRTPLIARTFG